MEGAFEPLLFWLVAQMNLSTISGKNMGDEYPQEIQICATTSTQR
jgi:hypothetical protein